MDSINNLFLFQTPNISHNDDTVQVKTVKLLFIKNLKQTDL